MTWREEAKSLGIKMYQRTKVDVLKDIEAALGKEAEVECKDIKITVDVRKATEICQRALFEHVSELGMVNITCEKWFLNCKRKGIVFKGQKNGS
jgi:hypothetical protein